MGHFPMGSADSGRKWLMVGFKSQFPRFKFGGGVWAAIALKILSFCGGAIMGVMRKLFGVLDIR